MLSETNTTVLTSNERPARKTNKWSLLLKGFLSLGVLGLVLYFVDFQEMLNVVLNLNPWYLVAILVLMYVDRGVMAYKWGLLLQAVNVRVPIFLLFRTYLISSVTNIVLPSTIGADLFRLYSLSRYKVEAQTILASIIAERVIGFIAILALVPMSLGIALYLVGNSWEYFEEVVVVVLIGGILAGVLIGTSLGGFRKVIDGLATRFAKYPGVGKLHQVYTIYMEYRNHRHTLAVVFTWTFIEQTAPIFGIFLLTRALHIDVTFVHLAAIIPPIMLAARMPIPFEGLGISEGIFVILFALVGVSATEALVLATFTRVLQYIPGLPWAIHYVITVGRPKELGKQPAPAAPQGLSLYQ